MAGSTADRVLLIIRFTASLPDLPLTIESPRTTTTLSLKRLIRSHIPEPYSSNRLRLIHAGKVLTDTSALSSSLKHLPPPPRDTPADNNGTSQSLKSKGKEPVYGSSTGKGTEPLHRVYIHCSIGDPLTASELSSEASEAARLEASLIRTTNPQPSSNAATASSAPSSSSTKLDTAATAASSHASSSSTDNARTSSDQQEQPRRDSRSTTTPAPQGFDRLLTAGFTASEVASLRSQFLSNIAYTHTPDTIPSGAALRALEDRWLDTGAQEHPSPIASGAEGGGAAGGGGWTGGFDAEDGGLEDVLWGNLLGFFWPVGALVWGMREEGVWTTRRKVAVALGCLVNIMFGFIKWSS